MHLVAFELAEPFGEGWAQLVDIGLALVLSTCIGLEREFAQKDAGLRTHALVGVGAALFVLISKYGFTDVLHEGTVVLDPSRVAAQIVTGIGFIGAGLIFVRGDDVRGLTTAAAVWETAAVGAACGAGLPLLAAAVVACHFLVVFGYPPALDLVASKRVVASLIEVRFVAGRDLAREVLAAITARGFSVSDVRVQADAEDEGRLEGDDRLTGLTLIVHGRPPLERLTSSIAAISGIRKVSVGEPSRVGF